MEKGAIVIRLEVGEGEVNSAGVPVDLGCFCTLALILKFTCDFQAGRQSRLVFLSLISFPQGMLYVTSDMCLSNLADLSWRSE